MDLLTHIFLPLIFLFAIGRFKKRYVLFSPASMIPDLDKLFLVGFLHSLFIILPILIAAAALEKKLRNSLEISSILSFFILSHLFLDILDGGPVAIAYPLSSLGIGVSFNAKIFVSNLTVSDLIPDVEIREIRASESYWLFSGFGFASMILFLLMLFKAKSR